MMKSKVARQRFAIKSLVVVGCLQGNPLWQSRGDKCGRLSETIIGFDKGYAAMNHETPLARGLRTSETPRAALPLQLSSSYARSSGKRWGDRIQARRLATGERNMEWDRTRAL